MPASAPEVVYEDQDLQLAIWSRVFINRWRTAATAPQLVRLHRHQRALIDAVGDRRIAVLTVLEDRSGLMPSSEAREQARRIAQDTRDAIFVQAQVVEGDGFVSATFRALLAGVMLAVRAPYPFRVFRSVTEALPWLEEHLERAGYQADARGVAEAIPELYRPSRVA